MDANYVQCPEKVECDMHMVVHHLETSDKEAIGVGAAFVRSAWEDLQQQHRFLIAGKQSFKLEQRTDDTRPRLLSKPEDQTLAEAGTLSPGPDHFGVKLAALAMHFTIMSSNIAGEQPPPVPKAREKGGKVRVCEGAQAQQSPLLSLGTLHVPPPHGLGGDSPTNPGQKQSRHPDCPYLVPRQEILNW